MHGLLMGTIYCDEWIARGKIQCVIMQFLPKSKYQHHVLLRKPFCPSDLKINFM